MVLKRKVVDQSWRCQPVSGYSRGGTQYLPPQPPSVFRWNNTIRSPPCLSWQSRKLLYPNGAFIHCSPVSHTPHAPQDGSVHHHCHPLSLFSPIYKCHPFPSPTFAGETEWTQYHSCVCDCARGGASDSRHTTSAHHVEDRDGGDDSSTSKPLLPDRQISPPPLPMESGEHRSVNPQIWKALAGTSARVPAVDSHVYYFPQGHAEQAWALPDFSATWCRKKPFYFLCRATDVQLLVNRDTDEVFARIRLVPVGSPLVPPPLLRSGPVVEDNPAEETGVVSFAKVLTPSDANNGGGFSVPRFCADSIFPPLNYSDEPPVQTISVRDVHGAVWDFRHIYRGTPRRHLLTTGWSKFVNSKKLIAGDSVVFVKDAMGDLFVGVQCGRRSSRSADYSRYAAALASSEAKPEDESGGGEGFSRNSRGKVSPESVVDAVRAAETGCPFEVVYYPRAGSLEFVVRAEVVDAAMSLYWSPGARVKMAVESDELSRTSWPQGTVNWVKPLDAGPYSCSPWRMLQVAWDEPDLLHAESVSPWQVEITPAMPPTPSPYPPIKRFRAQNPELLADATNFSKMVTGSTIASPFTFNISPAGMQGARQEPVFVSSLSIVETKSSRYVYSECVKDIPVSQRGNHVSTELSIGSSSHSGSSSPSQDSVLYNSPCSFQLFGKTIHTEQPADFSAVTSYVETERMTDAYSYSRSYQPKELYGIQNRRVSAVGAYST